MEEFETFEGQTKGIGKPPRGKPEVTFLPQESDGVCPAIQLSSELIDRLKIEPRTAYQVQISRPNEEIRLIKINKGILGSFVITAKAGGGIQGKTRDGNWRQLIRMRGVFSVLNVGNPEPITVDADVSESGNVITFSYSEAKGDNDEPTN